MSAPRPAGDVLTLDRTADDRTADQEIAADAAGYQASRQLTLAAAGPALTRDPRKWQRYTEEPGFMVAQSDLLAQTRYDALDWLSRHAMLMIKPEGWLGGVLPKVLRFLAYNDFEVVRVFRAELTPAKIHDIWRYSWNVGPVERIDLSELLLALGPTYGFVLADRTAPGGEWATTRLARMKGPSWIDRQQPGQLRYELRSPSRIMSYVHIPDEPADIVRDLSLMLGRPELLALLEQSALGSDKALTIRPGDFTDVCFLDHARSYQRRPETIAMPIAQRVALIKNDFERYQEGSRYRIPHELWQEMLDLCTAVSELPTTGTKLIEPLAEIGT